MPTLPPLVLPHDHCCSFLLDKPIQSNYYELGVYCQIEMLENRLDSHVQMCVYELVASRRGAAHLMFTSLGSPV